MALRVTLVFLLLICQVVNAQNRLAIYDLSWSGGVATISNERIIDSVDVALTTPAFHPTEPLVLYVRKAGQIWEIVSFNVHTAETKSIYHANDSIAFPQITPDKKHISFLRGAGRNLVKVVIGQDTFRTILDQPIESYLWIDDNSLFTISPGDPNSMNLVTLRPSKTIPVAQHVGGVLQRTGDNFAFVHKLSVDSWSVKKIDHSGHIEILTETLPESVLFTLTPADRIIMVSEGKMFGFAPRSGWQDVAVEKECSGIVELGASPAGDKIFILFTDL